MKHITLLCVAMIGAALPATLEAAHRQPLANAGYGIAAGGCFGSNCRPSTAQHVTTNYAPGSAYGVNSQCPYNCPPGQCNHLNYTSGTADYCPSGQCSPLNYTAGAADCVNGQCNHLNHTAGRADCINGQCNHLSHTAKTATCPVNGYCPQHGVYHSTRANGSNWQQGRYNATPVKWNRPADYSPPRANPYSARPAYDRNWSNTYRPASPSSSFGTSTTPFFN